MYFQQYELETTYTQDFSEYSALSSAIDLGIIPRITGIELYESEFSGHCLGFQLVYDNQEIYKADGFSYVDP